ncbi:hypothetical protein OOJ91_23205 [Micromonospora lupini]|uniref:hypothetical protein n=1 Tax=Micromonospora lupini TaxID=285679 RepID=UPI00225BD511|nr:hypothetical protein [Micromonospora lupini]MCX5068754.1 hypothetical protein [Micromonospora lupini]
MPYPSQEEVLRGDPLHDWIDEHFLRADPFAFDQIGFRSSVKIISSSLDIDPNGIFCTGSGAMGFSINPHKVENNALKRFNDGSDLDIALISEVHFEAAWRDLRKAAQPSTQPMDELVRDHINWQKKRFFDGAVMANKLLPALSFGADWVAASVRISEHICRLLDREIDVEFWIYRDYWSLRNYIADGVTKCRKLVA